MKFSFCQIPNINSTAFRWVRSAVSVPTPPVAVKIGSEIYQINNFAAETDFYLFTELPSNHTALELSINLHNSKITTVELANIYKIAHSFNLDENTLNIFKKEGIKGAKSFNILNELPSLPENLLKYMEEKNIPLKTIGLVLSFNGVALDFLADYAAKKNPSLQNFKQFAESVADFRALIANGQYIEGWEFPSKKSTERTNLENHVANLSKRILPATASVQDDFETGRINLSAVVSSYDQYEKIIEALEAGKKDAAALFALMKKHDLC